MWFIKGKPYFLTRKTYMIKNSTLNNLIKFIYKETTMRESIEVSSALAEDYLVNEVYEELYSAYKELPKATFSPRKSVLDSIISNSRCMA